MPGCEAEVGKTWPFIPVASTGVALQVHTALPPVLITREIYLFPFPFFLYTQPTCMHTKNTSGQKKQSNKEKVIECPTL